MNAIEPLEYLCPHCGQINLIYSTQLKDMYQEHLVHCSQCSTRLALVPATGMNDDINLIVSVADEDDVAVR
ncbi:hypothetical protein [Alteromonas sp. CYL-A6]|uniref:hypothetical protein n=1 Tax=Alteromonas nitratireducens TaxID=3390813 RepID=UPI0034AFFD30